MSLSKAERVYRERVTEQYILSQVNYFYDSESFSDHKRRMEDGDKLYKGDLVGLFPQEDNLPDIPYVENKFKNALHDISRLASEGRGMIKSIPRGDRERDLKGARLRESIADGYWQFNEMPDMERQLYLDLAGAGMAALSVYYNADSEYPQISRLDPRYIYPDVRNKKLQSLLNVEVVRERVLAHQYPHLGLNGDGDNATEVLFTCFYDEEGVSEAICYQNNAGKLSNATIVKQWAHELGTVPVGFVMLDTYDGAFHGLFEQLGGPLMVRNKVMRFLVDYMEEMVHAPFEARGILNAETDKPGPDTIYHHDTTVEGTTFMRRVAPAAPAGSVFGLLSYMGDQEEKESIQPPSRSGNVSQSIASGSFVDRTQGQLTSVIKELQDKSASLRRQVNRICFKMDERWLPASKPLLRPVGNKREYTPVEDIDGWYYHEVKFGAGAGLDRLNADTRVQNHLVAGLISREEARAEIDYLDDSTSSQDKINRERMQDAILQRFVTDPATPMSSIVGVFLDMADKGSSLEEALKKVQPELVQAEQAAAQPGAPGAPPAGAPDELAQGEPMAEQLKITAPMPPIGQVFPGRNFR